MVKKKKWTSDAVDILHHLYIGDDPKRLLEYEEAVADSRIARFIYDLRKEAGLSQKQLAKRVGTTAKAIDDAEMADYQGHLLAMLERIATVLGKEVDIRVVATKRKRKTA